MFFVDNYEASITFTSQPLIVLTSRMFSVTVLCPLFRTCTAYAESSTLIFAACINFRVQVFKFLPVCSIT